MGSPRGTSADPILYPLEGVRGNSTIHYFYNIELINCHLEFEGNTNEDLVFMGL
jgi:hypothetical protein